MNILIIEPSSSYAELISGILSSSQVVTTIVHSAKEAFDIIPETDFDGMCVAHELVDMNSLEFINHLKKLDNCTGIPKFLISSDNSELFRRNSYDAGYTDVFSKSDIAVLQRALRSMLMHVTYNIDANILYVEDVPSTAAYTISIMKNMGWSVTHVDTGEKALLLLESQDYDLIITDLILPGAISGMKLINEIREQSSELDCPLPILALSGWNDLLRQVFVLQQGASDFISKPFEEIDFLARALNLIQSKKTLEAFKVEREKLHDKVHTDNLTGLYNRHVLDDYAQTLLRTTLEQNSSMAILFFDIDHFKQINDKHGHAIGDQVLCKIGSILNKNSRENDLSIRYGGEEFLVLIPGCNKRHAIKKAEQLRLEIELLKPMDINVTTSIGLTCASRNSGTELDILIETADKALFQAKENGRNSICFID